MLQFSKGRYLESYLWEPAVDWRQLFPLGRYGNDSIIRHSFPKFRAKWKNEEKYLFYSVIY